MQAPWKPGTRAAVPGMSWGSPAKLGFSGQIPVSTTPITWPRPALSGPPAAFHIASTPSASAVSVMSTGRVTLRSTRATPGGHPQPLDLAGVEPGGEAVDGGGVAVEHLGPADRVEDPVLLAEEPLPVGGHLGAGPVEPLTGRGPGGREAGDAPGVGRGGTADQRHDVHPVAGHLGGRRARDDRPRCRLLRDRGGAGHGDAGQRCGQQRGGGPAQARVRAQRATSLAQTGGPGDEPGSPPCSQGDPFDSIDSAT